MEAELHGNKLRVYRNGTIERLKDNSWIVATQWIHKHGYKDICLSCNGKRKHYKVHRVVAFVYFCIDINNRHLFVRPIDKNPANANLSNLRIEHVTPRRQKTNTNGVYYNKTTEQYNELHPEKYSQ